MFIFAFSFIEINYLLSHFIYISDKAEDGPSDGIEML